MSGATDRQDQGLTVAWASLVAVIVAPVSLIVSTQGLFVEPMTKEFGWSRATYFLGPSIGTLIGAIASIFLGAIADRWGSRLVLIFGAVVYGLAVASLALMDGSLLQYVLINVVLFAAGQSQTSVIYSRVIATWYDKKLGIMLAVAGSGYGIGAFLFPLAGKALLDNFDWRTVYLILGALILLVSLTSIILFVRENTGGRLSDDEKSASLPTEVCLTLREAARTREYWILFAFFFLVSFAIYAVAVNMVPLVTDRGVSVGVAVAGLSILALGRFVGRLASGYLLDRILSPQITSIFFILSATGIFVFNFAYGSVTILIASLLIGLAAGAESEMIGYYSRRYFGTQYLARIAGTMFFGVHAATAAGAVAMGYLFDVYGNYSLAIMVMTGAMALAVGLLFMLRPYPGAERLTQEQAPA